MAGPNELAVPWAFWAVGVERSAYDVNPLPSFSTVEDFWGWWDLIPSVTRMRYGTIALFKNGIKPAWEDKRNKTRIRLTPQDAEREPLWEFLVLKAIGGTLEADLQDVVSGLCFIVSPRATNIEIWYGTDQPSLDKLQELLRANAKYQGSAQLKPFRVT
jgi:hypothetical protein